MWMPNSPVSFKVSTGVRAAREREFLKIDTTSGGRPYLIARVECRVRVRDLKLSDLLRKPEG